MIDRMMDAKGIVVRAWVWVRTRAGVKERFQFVVSSGQTWMGNEETNIHNNKLIQSQIPQKIEAQAILQTNNNFNFIKDSGACLFHFVSQSSLHLTP